MHTNWPTSKRHAIESVAYDCQESSAGVVTPQSELEFLDQIGDFEALPNCRGILLLRVESGQIVTGQAGLGQKLFEALEKKVAVVGVAKTRFHTATDAIEIHRGKRTRPLFVSAVGMDACVAADHVKAMHGNFRIPTLLKLADTL